MTKRKNNKIFTNKNKLINKDSGVLEINTLLFEVKKSINKRLEMLSSIELKAISIKNKIEETPLNIRIENVIEDLPAINLRELEGDFSRKLRYKDLCDLYKMNKQSSKIIEEQEILLSKEKMLNIELLQKKIEIILDDN